MSKKASSNADWVTEPENGLSPWKDDMADIADMRIK